MAIFKLFHAQVRGVRFEDNPRAWPARAEGDYEMVAEVEAKSLYDAYMRTQSVDRPWSEGNRSTSVGDVFIDEQDRAHMVARVGFTEVSNEGGTDV